MPPHDSAFINPAQRCERVAARGLPTATCASVVILGHLRLAPLSKEERELLNRAIGELGAIGRNLNQIARAANQGAPVVGPVRAELMALLPACEALRRYVRPVDGCQYA